MQILEQALSQLSIGVPQSLDALTIWPLLSQSAYSADYLTLDEALEGKRARVTEVSESGSVPELRFENHAERDVLLMDGEELVGARQNRILNLSILVGAGKSIVIPVSCVERGRWSYRGREFASGKKALFAKARAKKMAQVSLSLDEQGHRRADQSMIWHDIDYTFQKHAAYSDTSAMSDVYEKRARRLDDYTKAFPLEINQAGAVFAINGKIVGLELFDAPATYAKLAQKIIHSYALDALEDEQNVLPDPLLAWRFLGEVTKTEVKRFTALGEGEDIRLSSADLAGGALIAKERVVHLSAFRLNGSDN